jgi:hypothetical protein
MSQTLMWVLWFLSRKWQAGVKESLLTIRITGF